MATKDAHPPGACHSCCCGVPSGAPALWFPGDRDAHELRIDRSPKPVLLHGIVHHRSKEHRTQRHTNEHSHTRIDG